MKEPAPEAHEPQDNSIVRREFELIQDDFEFIPDGPVFSAIWPNEVDITDLTKRKFPTATEIKALKDSIKKAEKEGVVFEAPVYKPVITSGLTLVAEIMIQTGALHTADTVAKLTEQRDALMKAGAHEFSPAEEKLYKQLVNTIRLNDYVKRSLTNAYNTYYSEDFWDDPIKKTGLKTDELEVLYDMTEAYENQGILLALRQVEQEGAFTSDITSEANRIGRIMVAKEINAIA